MPYIRPALRPGLDAGAVAFSPGELNYLLTKAIDRYWQTHPRNYQTINDIVGALEGAKTEFQWRIVRDYEDRKIAQNGDVYTDAEGE